MGVLYMYIKRVHLFDKYNFDNFLYPFVNYHY